MTEQEKCLDFVNKALTRASSTTTSSLHSEQQMKLQQSIYKYVLKHVKEAYCKGKMFTGVPEIAANFCLLATGQNGLPSFDELFKFFAEDKSCEPQWVTFGWKIGSNRVDRILNNFVSGLQPNFSFRFYPQIEPNVLKKRSRFVCGLNFQCFRWPQMMTFSNWRRKLLKWRHFDRYAMVMSPKF